MKFDDFFKTFKGFTSGDFGHQFVIEVRNKLSNQVVFRGIITPDGLLFNTFLMAALKKAQTFGMNFGNYIVAFGKHTEINKDPDLDHVDFSQFSQA